MRVAPDFFGKRKRRDAGDEFYRDKTRASKARVDDVGDGVPYVPQIRTNHNVYDYFILIYFKYNLTYIFAAIKYIVCRLCFGNRQNFIDCRLNQSLRNLGEHIFNQ